LSKFFKFVTINEQLPQGKVDEMAISIKLPKGKNGTWNTQLRKNGLGNSNQIALRSNFIEEKGNFLNDKKWITSQTY
jgi:hypothetical protein